MNTRVRAAVVRDKNFENPSDMVEEPAHFLVSSSRAMLGPYSSQQWIARYERSHQHPVNRLCHTYGIPTILVSLPIFLAGFLYHRLWYLAAFLFLSGWMLQFVGHAFEGKPPEFFHDWRFLFVGVRWWWAKVSHKPQVETRVRTEVE